MDPTPPSPLATWLAYLERDQLAYQVSRATQQVVFSPRLIAPGSGATDLEWRVSAGRGTVHATTVVHPQGGAPFNVALIDMDEGFRLMSRVEDIPPEAVRIGQRVRFRTHRPPAGPVGSGDAGEPPCPVFYPAEDAA